jgi:hypothetical protein
MHGLGHVPQATPATRTYLKYIFARNLSPPREVVVHRPRTPLKLLLVEGSELVALGITRFVAVVHEPPVGIR